MSELPRPTPVISVHPITLSAPDRGDDLQVRVSAPTTGHELPVILFSHGYHQSATKYGPLADFWAAHGFVVIQPTHLDSLTLDLAPDDPRTPLIWKFRIDDLKRTLDHLDVVESAVPGLAGRLDRTRIAAAGHSWGAQSASALLGVRVLDVDGNPGEDMSDPRIKAGLLLAVTGTGGSDLSPFAAANFPFMSPSYAQMSTPTLVVAGDQDDSPLSVRGPDWFTDAYHLSPGSKSLLSLVGAEHSLGGISEYESTATTDESPQRVALIQRLSWAYLRNALGLKDATWPVPVDSALGRLEST
jgi:dienelactone hydrolase